jgi:hypothetical protein
MRRVDQSVLTPHERDELDRMWNTLANVKEALRCFEDGEINLRDAVYRVATVISDGRAA